MKNTTTSLGTNKAVLRYAAYDADDDLRARDVVRAARIGLGWKLERPGERAIVECGARLAHPLGRRGLLGERGAGVADRRRIRGFGRPGAGGP